MDDVPTANFSGTYQKNMRVALSHLIDNSEKARTAGLRKVREASKLHADVNDAVESGARFSTVVELLDMLDGVLHDAEMALSTVPKCTCPFCCAVTGRS